MVKLFSNIKHQIKNINSLLRLDLFNDCSYLYDIIQKGLEL